MELGERVFKVRIARKVLSAGTLTKGISVLGWCGYWFIGSRSIRMIPLIWTFAGNTVVAVSFLIHISLLGRGYIPMVIVVMVVWVVGQITFKVGGIPGIRFMTPKK